MPTMENASLEALFCLFKGEWGTRKSTQALSFPKPQYWFDFDQKMEGLILPMRKWGIEPKDISYDTYNDWNKAEEKLKRFQQNCPFSTIVIDTISSAGDAINTQTRKVKSGKDTGDENKGKKIAGITVNSMEDFNAEATVFQDMMNYLKDIQKYNWETNKKAINVILIGHVINDTIKPGVTHQARVLVTGAKKAAAKIPGRCHEVYHFNMKGDFTDKLYSILTTHSSDDFARTALPLEKEIVFGDDPLYDRYLKKAIEKLKTMPRELPQSF